MFDIHQQLLDEEGGAWDEETRGDYCDALVHEFAASPEGIEIAERHGNIYWIHSFLDFTFDYIESTPIELSYGDVSEILFEWFPRKVSTEPEDAWQIVAEIRAFFEFLHHRYGLANAAGIVKKLGEKTATRMEREMADPENFGMAKSLFMAAARGGYDVDSQEGLNEFMHDFNAGLSGVGPVNDTAEPYWRVDAPSRPKPMMKRLTAQERKSREKLRQQKLGKAKRRR